MRVRLIALAVLAVAGLTAFAPAPFMKTDRHKGSGGEGLAAMQGTWQITEKTRMGPNGQSMAYATRQKVEISEDSWQYVTTLAAKGGKGGGIGGKGGGGGFGGKGGVAKATSINYKLVVDSKRQPNEFRVKRSLGGINGKLGNSDVDYMIGIVQVRGDTMKMLYRLGTRSDASEVLPRDFATVPEGWYSMTLKREK